jgi:hypothetical protein
MGFPSGPKGMPNRTSHSASCRQQVPTSTWSRTGCSPNTKPQAFLLATSSPAPRNPVTIAPHTTDPQCTRLLHRPAGAAAGRMGAGGAQLVAAAGGVAGVPAGNADPDRTDACLR